MATLPKRKRRSTRTASTRKRARGHNAERQKHNESTSQDRISELPDDLLKTILGHLDTRSSAATSVLSRRWQHLWKSVPKLRFSYELPRIEIVRFLRDHRYVSFRPSLCPWRQRVELNPLHLNRLLTRYRSRIFSSSLIGFLRKSNNSYVYSTKISSLVLCCLMDNRYVKFIDKVVNFAICRGVEDLNLETILGYPCQRPDTARYKFPLSLFTDGKGLSLTKLDLTGCTLDIPIGFDGFKSVVELSFTRIEISEDMIQTLLENCPKLKKFYLSHCWGIAFLKIASLGLELREIMVYSCLPITHMELVAPKLQQFKYTGKCKSMVFDPVPPIEHAWLDYDDREEGDSFMYIVGKLSIDFPFITSLTIIVNTCSLKNTITPEGLLAVFKNLKCLTLRVIMYANDDLGWASMLLEAAPILEKFQIEVLTNGKRKHPGGVLWEPSNFEHHHLRHVKIYNSRMMRHEFALARLLLARAPLLQTMTFLRGDVLRYADWTAEYLETDKDWTVEQKSAIVGKLAGCNISGARLEFMS